MHSAIARARASKITMYVVLILFSFIMITSWTSTFPFRVRYSVWSSFPFLYTR